MFGLLKNRETQTEQWKSGELEQPPKEIIEMREFISVDSMKAHLVDILEENRRLKANNEDLRERSRKNDSENRGKYELVVIEADEYKKRVKEAEKKIVEKDKEIDRMDRDIEKLQKEHNSLIAEAEMAKERLEKDREERRNAAECENWLEATLKSYGDWEKITKTQLVSIIKDAMKK